MYGMSRSTHDDRSSEPNNNNESRVRCDNHNRCTARACWCTLDFYGAIMKAGLPIAAILIATNGPVFSEPFRNGVYASERPPYYQMVVQGSTTYGADIIVTGKIPPTNSCSGNPWRSTVKYHLPPTYNGYRVDPISGTCSGEWECNDPVWGNFILRCGGVGDQSVDFTQDYPNLNMNARYRSGRLLVYYRARRKPLPQSSDFDWDLAWANLTFCPPGLICTRSTSTRW